LSEAKLAKEGASLEITCLFGGLEIIVPKNVIVETHGTPILGGWKNKTTPKPTSSKVSILNVTGTVIFGGVEIKE